jgi:hypothetical protein
MCGIGHLVDAMIDLMDVTWFRRETEGYIDSPLAMNLEFNGTYRADGGALTAQGAFILVPQDPPQEVANTQ